METIRSQDGTPIAFDRPSFPWMSETARALGETLPDGQLSLLDGQTHDVSPDAMASVLQEFFKD